MILQEAGIKNRCFASMNMFREPDHLLWRILPISRIGIGIILIETRFRRCRYPWPRSLCNEYRRMRGQLLMQPCRSVSPVLLAVGAGKVQCHDAKPVFAYAMNIAECVANCS